VQIQKTADNLKRIQAQLEKKNKSLTGDMEAQRTQLNQKVFSAQQEADKVTLLCPGLPCPALLCPALPCPFLPALPYLPRPSHPAIHKAEVCVSCCLNLCVQCVEQMGSVPLGQWTS